MNPRWRISRASRPASCLLLDAGDKATMERRTRRIRRPGASTATSMPACRTRVAFFTCTRPNATAIATLADPEIKPIDQNTARYYNRVASTSTSAVSPTTTPRANAWRRRSATRTASCSASRRPRRRPIRWPRPSTISTTWSAPATRSPSPTRPGRSSRHAAGPGRTDRARLGRLWASSFAHFAAMKQILDEEDPSYASENRTAPAGQRYSRQRVPQNAGDAVTVLAVIHGEERNRRRRAACRDKPRSCSAGRRGCGSCPRRPGLPSSPDSTARMPKSG